MKNLKFTTVLFLGLQVSSTLYAQNEELTLVVPSFAKPLVENWVNEYGKTHEDINFQIVSGISNNQDNTITLTSEEQATVSFAEYPLLPVAAASEELEKVLGNKRLNAKKISNLFFYDDDEEEDDGEEERKPSKVEKAVNVYSSASKKSVTNFFAKHFKHLVSDFKGKKILGDDAFLIRAVLNDKFGVSVNPIFNIYNIDTRKVQDGLKILPLDIDKKSSISIDNGNLDDVLNLLEQKNFAEIPIMKLGLSYDFSNDKLNGFVAWILTEGTKHLHHFGLLELSDKELQAQLHKIKNNELAQK